MKLIKLNKIDFWQIIVSHYKTLVNNNSKKPSKDDWILFLIIPLIISIGLVYFKKEISQNTINLIITALSIFVGLLINVLVLVFSLIQREAAGSIKIEVLKQTIHNITYTILVSIVAILCCFCVAFDPLWVKTSFSFFVYFLSIHFFLTLLMVVKRMYLLFISEFDQSKLSSNAPKQ